MITSVVLNVKASAGLTTMKCELNSRQFKQDAKTPFDVLENVERSKLTS